MNVHFRINSRALVVGVTTLARSMVLACGGDGPTEGGRADISTVLYVASNGAK
jgi:hypothetical protein